MDAASLERRRSSNDPPPLMQGDRSDGYLGLAVHKSSLPPPQSLTSPTTPAYPGPPPPYSFHSNATNGTGVIRNGYTASATDASSPTDEKAPSRRSLPSIHEALGKGHAPLYPPSAHTTALPPLPPTSTAASYSAPTAISPTQRSFSDAQPPYGSHAMPPYAHEKAEGHPHPPYRRSPRLETATVAARPQDYTATSNVTSPVAAAGAHQEPLYPRRASPTYAYASRGATSPTYPAAPSSQAQSPTYPSNSTSNIPSASYSPFTQPSPTAASSSYRNYAAPAQPPPPPPPAYSYPPANVSAFASVNAPPPPPPTYGHERPEADETRKAGSSKPTHGQQHYGEAVKRHLDIFDLESSLNEVAEGCGRGLNFAQHFGSRAHQHQRSGPTLSSLPSLAECDDLLQRHERVLQSLARVREFVVAQQQQQQHASTDRAHEDGSGSQASGSRQRGEYGDDSSHATDKSERFGGFGDAKKRRGRNAPPGRCHSCNRAETPEWRRGPDGARTLCNACGLHYAKLTRKHGVKPNMTSSNLRAKENGEP